MIGARACVRTAAACVRCRVVPSTSALLRRHAPAAALRSHSARTQAIRTAPVWGVRGFATEGADGSSDSDSAGGEEAEAPVVTTEAPADDAASAAPAAPVDMTVLKPREVVAQLDRHIIGQQDAKRAVAIALRNRWRRLQLPAELQPEVMPKNILMVGPTGCGKTEVARRLANLVHAPFVKVEATKFTEVGFHGRDVDMIIRDLVEVSANLTKKQKTEQLQAEVKAAAEDQVLEILCGPSPREDTVNSFRSLLRKGELNQKLIKVDVPVDKGPSIRIGGGGIGGAEVIGQSSLRDLLSNLGGKKSTEQQELPVEEALPVLEEAELERRLSGIDIMKEAIHNAEQNGIVFIDEIDKITTSSSGHRSPDASAEGVQRDLLPLVEGSIVNTKHGNVNTDHMLFIASGAFHSVKPSDLLPELQGRLPIRVQLNALTEKDMRRILTETESNLIMQQIALIGTEGVTLRFNDDAVAEIAHMAAEMNLTVENIGARRLQTVMERLVEDISFDAADMEPGSEIVVDVELVRERLGEMLKKSDLSKFIL